MCARSFIVIVVSTAVAACATSPDAGHGAAASSSAGTVTSQGSGKATAAATGGAASGPGAETDQGTVSSGATTATGTTGTSTTDGTGGAGARLPAEILNLDDWKLTLPVGDPGDPQEVLQPALSTFVLPPFFHPAPGGDAVVFRAPVGGATTSGSSYPRSELREMTAGGAEKAAWSTTEGTHTMEITQAVTATPPVKPHVVAGQIHDANDDVVMIRLEGPRLFVEAEGTEVEVLDPGYVLGTPFRVKIEATAGFISIFYEDMLTPKVVLPRDRDGCYFKAGVYTQSNPSKGDAPDAYGEVWIYDLTVTHG